MVQERFEKSAASVLESDSTKKKDSAETETAMDAMRQFEGALADGGLGAPTHIAVTGGRFFRGMSCVNRV